MPHSVTGMLLLTLWSTLAPAAWVRVDTPHFVVFSQSSEGDARDVATEFERFRQAVARMLPIATTESPVPTVVVAFASARTLAPFAPRFNGKPIEVDGFFHGTETDNVIALSLEKREEALRIVFHEYTHLVISGTAHSLPTWVNEGLADYYSTFQMREDGRGGVSGRPILSHLLLLEQRRMMTIDELIGVDRDSPLYNEGDRRSVFYAQSWALVHMLISSSGARADAFKRYLALSADGTSSSEAWRLAFGTFDVIAELKSYLRGFSMVGFAYKFDQIKTAAMTSTIPSTAEVETAMAILLRRIDPGGAARHAEKGAAAQPASALAYAVFGLMQVDARPGSAERLLLEATRDPTDWLAQYYAAAGLAQMVSGAMLESERPRITAARAALRTVMSAKPELAHPYALLAFVAEPEESIASAAKARTLAPGRPDYVYLEAQARANHGEFVPARELLKPLTTSRYSGDVRERARALIDEIVARERSERAGQQPVPPPNAPPAATPKPPAPNDPIRVDDPTPGTGQEIYRVLKAGEKRTEGSIRRIVCGRNGAVTLQVVVDGAALLFTATALRDIEFITYRNDRRQAVTCGARTAPEKVFVSWLPMKPAAKGIAGRATAVEFLAEK